MPTYHIYDLIINSDIIIPIFKKSNTQPKKSDIIVRFFKGDLKKSYFYQKKLFFSNGSVFYEDKYGTKFIISNKLINENIEVLIYSNKNKSKNIWESFVGIPLGYALSFKGFNVVHGSSVSISNNAACIFGFSGQGKSTLALSLINKGFNFLTEDLCIFDKKEIIPFNPWIKTSSALIKKLKVETESEINLSKDSRKRNLFKIPKKHSSKKCTPKIAYFLVNDEKKSISKLEKSKAFEFLFSNFYRFDNKKAFDLQRITYLIESLDFYVFNRNINSSIEKNSEFLSNHMKNLLC